MAELLDPTTEEGRALIGLPLTPADNTLLRFDTASDTWEAATGVFPEITGLGTQVQELNMGTEKIINAGDPTDPQDVVTRAFGDANYLLAIKTINADSTAAQIIAAGTGLGIVDAGATHTLSIDATVATLTGIQALTNKTQDDFSNLIHADGVHVQVRNESGGGYVRGDVVHVSGYSIGEDLPLTVLADASSSATMAAIGIVTETIANNASGQVLKSGRLSGVATGTFTAGDTIYVSEVAGEFTNVKPTGTALIQNIGTVLRSHATLGVIEIASMQRSNDLPNIPDGEMWIGNASAVPTPVVMSGDITISNTGVTTIGTGAVDISMLSASGTPDGTTFLRGDNTWSVPGAGGDMILAAIQTVTGAKTFGTIGGAVGKFILAGSTSGSTIFNAAAIAGATTITLPGTTGTVALLGNKLSDFANTTSAELAGVISDETGSGLLVFGTSPTLITPALGTPSALVLTSATGLPVGGLADGTDGELITWSAAGVATTVAVGTAGQILTSNGVGVAPTFQAVSLTPWIEDIDADGFDLQDLSNIEFRVTAGLPAGTVPYLAHEATGITVNVPTGDTVNIDVNNVETYSFGVTNADFKTHNIIAIKGTQFTQETLTYNATQVFDFDDNQYQQITLTGVLSTLTTDNRATGKMKTVRIVGDSVDRVLTFNTSWKTNPSDATVTVLANTRGYLSLYCGGAAETDVDAVYAEFS